MTNCISGLRAIMARLQKVIGVKNSSSSSSSSSSGGAGEKRRSLQISQPFNFKHETVSLPGLSEDEIAILKEKAAASRLGVASDDRLSSLGGGDSLRNPRKAPAPPSPMRSITPVVQITPSTPITPVENLI